MQDTKRCLFWAVLTTITGAAALLAQSGPPQWISVTAERLLTPAAGDWLSYRRTYDVTGFSPLSQIDRTTVRQLRPVWSYSVRDSSRWVPTPVVVNGLMYVVEGSGRVLAFDAVSGDTVWIHERQYPDDISVSQAFGRHRGVSIYGDAVYWGTADAYLVALDARTGRLLWEVKTGDYHTGEGHNHPPLIADGRVFLGHAGGDRGARGKFRAYDAEDGTLLWTVYTAPGPGDPGYETWARRDVPPLGGAPWNTASYDPELRLVYFSTGQPAPWSSTQRGLGDALYTNSVVAVDARSGKIRWHFQLVPADDWDRAAYENMLVDLVINGRPRKALIQTGKIGWGVVLDRETGEFLHAFKTAYDNVITGWTPQGRPIVNPAAVPAPADVGSGKVFEICPHLHGARNLQAPSYSPVTRLYYAGINNSCMDAQIVPVEYVLGRSYTGVTYTPKLAPGYDYVGEFVAFNPVTGQRAWAYRPESGAAMTASALATGGGIVFGGTADRNFFALHSETGQLLWQTRLSGDVSGAPVTFEVNAKQYVAVGAGGRSGPTTSFAPLTDVDLPQGSGSIWVFALPDTDSQTSSRNPEPVIRSTSGVQKPAAAAPVAAQAVFTAGQASRGEQLYNRACSACHNAADQTGASLRTRWGNSTVGELFKLISTTMPENAPGSLPPADYASIVAFLLSQSGYPPGAAELPADAAALSSVRIEPPPR